MKFELEFFEDFIQSELKKSPTSNIGDLEEKTNTIQEEVERVKKSLRDLF